MSMLPVLLSRVTSLRKSEKGATMVEYGIMVALIAVFCIVAVTAVGTNLVALFGKVVAGLAAA